VLIYIEVINMGKKPIKNTKITHSIKKYLFSGIAQVNCVILGPFRAIYN
jgi:hypothetical protein